MKTYQDFLEIAEKGEQARMDFVISAIDSYKATDLYKTALTAGNMMSTET